jgi:hypothetical protein
MDVPAELDWVTARSQRSLVSVFERLRLGVGKDTAVRPALPGEAYGFELAGGAKYRRKIPA